MYKPAIRDSGEDSQPENGSSRWDTTGPRWYLWDGGFLALGRSAGVVPPHAHHAFQLVIAIDGEICIKGTTGDWRSGRGLVVPPDVEHSYDGNSAIGAMLFVDPESNEGVWLRSTFRREIAFVPEQRIVPCADELRTFLERPHEAMEIRALILQCVKAMCAGAPPARKMDERITKVLQEIRSSEDLRISVESAAASVFLSEGRFAHLFKQQVGLPFRRYMLWRKLARAVVAIGRERTLAAAAHAADFSDAAHLTRTFYQMFGIPPSVMMRGSFYEIESPF
ncbi:MAG TPA: AraC family transcriptional regulator [Thermoanaerobaculia bacterium]|nr:AraC family transcriptional regulator [Thermoanaerobaculia bacterium]